MSGAPRPRRVLHVGTGFRPWRRGGLVAYVEDLITAQAAAGHEVAYLFAGRLYPFGRGPRIKRWTRDGVPMLEILNSPIHDHGRQPELELHEPRLERIVADAVRELRPDVVHVHELCGLPSSILDVAGAGAAPVVFTLQDYFALCPTFKLLDHAGRTCLRAQVGEDCVATIAADPRDPALLYDATVRADLEVRAPTRWLPQGRRDRLGRHLRPRMTALARPRVGPTPLAGAEVFQRRREVNVERLNRVDRLIAMSSRVAEIHQELGVDPDRLRTMQLTLAHIERLRPRTERRADVLTFATLGAGESAAKGADLLLDAWRAVAGPAAGRARLLLCGHVAPRVAAAAAEVPGIEVAGAFTPDGLDAMLDRVDVGILPSVWEEAYGYAGVEFLAKGIPVVANAIGGMPDYVRDGETGWLNGTCDAAGLAVILRNLIENPDQVDELAARVRRRRDVLIKPMARHVEELDAVYDEVIAARGAAASGRLG